MQRLLAAELDLRAADPHLSVTPRATGTKLKKLANWITGAPSASVVEAYAAAATAAFHRDPLAHQEFLGSSGVPVQLLMFSEFMPIKDDRLLSVENLNSLSMAIRKSAPPVDKRHRQQEQVPRELRDVPNREFARENRFFGQLRRVRRMVESALDAFNSSNPAARLVSSIIT